MVKLSSSLRRHVEEYVPAAGLNIELEPDRTVGDVVEDLGLPLSGIKIIMVNGKHAGLDHTLADGDRLALFPAVGGG